MLLSDEQVIELNRYYQRLVARDQNGAVEVVEELLQTQTLTDVYDAVLLPALYYAAKDQRRNNLTTEEARFIYQATREIVDNLGASQAATAVVEVPVAPQAAQAAISGIQGRALTVSTKPSPVHRVVRLVGRAGRRRVGPALSA